MTISLHVSLLGSWQAELCSEALPVLPTRHARVLLAQLACAYPHRLPRTRLYSDLFPGVAPESAARHLRTTLYLLRRVLGGLLCTSDAWVALASGLVVTTDLARFEALSVPEAGLDGLVAAMALYRGPFLGHPSDGWAAGEAQRLHGVYIDVLRRLVVLSQAAGAYAVMLDAAQRWVAEEPWCEEAHITLLQALVAQGDRAAAAAQLVRSKNMLRSALGTVPLRVEAIGRAVLRLQPAPPAARPRAAAGGVLAFEQLRLSGGSSQLERRDAWHLRAAALRQQLLATLVEPAAAAAYGRRSDVASHQNVAEGLRRQGKASLLRSASAEKLALRCYDAAIELAQKALRCAQATGDVDELFACQSALACTLLGLCLFDEGLALAETTLELGRRLGDQAGIVPLLVVLAQALLPDDGLQAEALLAEAIGLAEAHGLAAYATQAYGLLALRDLAQGRLRAAQIAVTAAGRWLEQCSRQCPPVAHIAAQIALATGDTERACRHAAEAITWCADEEQASFHTPLVLWDAASVLAEAQGPDVAAPLFARAHARFLDDLQRLADPARRRALLDASPTHWAIASYCGKAGMLVLLPRHDAPGGRPLHVDEQVPVVWRVDTVQGPRQECVRRLVAVAEAQGAVATINALATALGTSPRTIQRDLQALRDQGIGVVTRGTAPRRLRASG